MTIKTIHAGHGGIDPGAVGNGYKEADIARQITNKMIAKTGAYNATDDTATSVNDNLAKIVRNVESQSKSGSDWNISNHLNSASPSATGVEVFYFRSDSEAKIKAEQVSEAISKALGIPNRGAKHGNDLYVIRNTTGKMLLIEWGFISNAGDVNSVLKNMDEAIDDVLKLFGYSSANNAQPSGLDPHRSFSVEISPFSEGEALDRLQEFRKAFPHYSAHLIQLDNKKQYKIVVQPFTYLEVNAKHVEIKSKFPHWSMKVAELTDVSQRKAVVVAPYTGEEAAEKYLEMKKEKPGVIMDLENH